MAVSINCDSFLVQNVWYIDMDMDRYGDLAASINWGGRSDPCRNYLAGSRDWGPSFCVSSK